MAEDVNVVDINEAARLAGEEKEEKKEEPKEEKKVTPYDETPDGKNAKALWDALSDPDKAAGIIKELAEKNGYTKAEVKEIKQAIKDDDFEALREALGDDFSDFTTKFTPALQKIIDRRVEEAVKPYKEESQEAKSEKLQTEISTLIHDLTESTFGVKELTTEQKAELGKLIKKYPPAAGVKPKEYLTDFFKLLPGQKASVRTKNRSDVGSRLSSAAGGDVEGNNDKPASGVKMTLQEAAQKAYEENEKKG